MTKGIECASAVMPAHVIGCAMRCKPTLAESNPLIRREGRLAGTACGYFAAGAGALGIGVTMIARASV